MSLSPTRKINILPINLNKSDLKINVFNTDQR